MLSFDHLRPKKAASEGCCEEDELDEEAVVDADLRGGPRAWEVDRG